ncbi:bidirectional hydrogenase complex protein HoxU [Desulfogranum mediterraneum]|uniref:bidirectional hydrogenase complex protein HoxU n=1 Tax=Desulfogranum mediterraneum TaxID=160661 RepID=UPI00040E4267|nr:bidirectional hydrogenase complex protein HoxU [Desulfogranum mediterraneum]
MNHSPASRNSQENTPPPRILTLQIDGQDLSGRADETILEIARQNKIHIPTLCRLDGLSGHGGCRLCLVEISGQNRPVPACLTYPQEGMVISTASQRLQDYRRKILELLFSERNHVCAVCVSNGHCELQELAVELGLSHVRYEYLHPRLEVDGSHARFIRDPNRCVLCLRCVRVCAEVEGAHTWDVMGRGISSRVITDLNQAWGSSQSCTACGKCVQVCPTGALSEKGTSVAEMIKHRHFLPQLLAMRTNRRE